MQNMVDRLIPFIITCGLKVALSFNPVTLTQLGWRSALPTFAFVHPPSFFLSLS